MHISSHHSSNKSVSTIAPSPCTEDNDYSNPSTFFFGRKKTISEYKLNTSDNNNNILNQISVTKKEKMIASCKILRKLCRSFKKTCVTARPKVSEEEIKEPKIFTKEEIPIITIRHSFCNPVKSTNPCILGTDLRDLFKGSKKKNNTTKSNHLVIKDISSKNLKDMIYKESPSNTNNNNTSSPQKKGKRQIKKHLTLKTPTRKKAYQVENQSISAISMIDNKEFNNIKEYINEDDIIRQSNNKISSLDN